MATFQLSPGVRVTETDLTNIIPAVATAVGGSVGKFKWGPAYEPTLISDEAQLLSVFGYPVASTIAASNVRQDWYTAANFLNYSSSLELVRVLSDAAQNAASEPAGGGISVNISAAATVGGPATFNLYSDSDGNNVVGITVNIPDNITSSMVLGEILRQAIVNASYSPSGVNTLPVPLDARLIPGNGNTVNLVYWPANSNAVGQNFAPRVVTTIAGATLTYGQIGTSSRFLSGALIENNADFLDKQSNNELNSGSVYARFAGDLGNGIGVVMIDASMSDSDFRTQQIFGYRTLVEGAGVTYVGGVRAVDLFNTVPGTSPWAVNNGWTNLKDEVHVVVYTTDTTVTGTSGQVLETYSYLSKAKNGLDTAAQPNYYVDVINAQSQWVYLLGEQRAIGYQAPTTEGVIGLGATVNNATAATTFVSFMPSTPVRPTQVNGVRQYQLNSSTDGGGVEVDVGNYTRGWDLLRDTQQVDVNLLVAGNPLDSITQISEATRQIQKYVMAVADDRKDAVAFISPGRFAAVTTATARAVYDYFNGDNAFNSSSYGFLDSGWKQQYDRYNDEYFWMPLGPDMAGLAANTSQIAADWFSPAGYNRGFIKNVVKLGFNPTSTDRDLLYPGRINPVVTERGQGTLLLGDKTALTRPSAFDRLNVRRLFIVLEKAIATAARFQLFEFNDEFTRANFVAQVEPFLQDIQSRRGLTEFLVKCDASNNTAAVVSGNRFVADIYVRPNYSINFISLNFIAVGPNVNFTEIAGA